MQLHHPCLPGPASSRPFRRARAGLPLLVVGAVGVAAAAVACGSGGSSPAGESSGTTAQRLVSPPFDFGDQGVMPSGQENDNPSLAFGAGEYMGAWSRYTDRKLIAMRFSPAGASLDPVGIVVADVGTAVVDQIVVRFDGTRFRAFFPWGALATSRIAPDGTLLDATPKALPGTIVTSNLFGVDCASSVCLAAWASLDAPDGAVTNYLAYARVDADGKPLDSSALLVPTDKLPDSIDVVATSKGWVVVWTTQQFRYQGAPDFPVEQWAMGIDAKGVAGTPQRLFATASADQRLDSHVATNGASVLVGTGFYDSSFAPTACYGTRLGLDGAPLEPTSNTYASTIPCGALAGAGAGYVMGSYAGSSFVAQAIGADGALTSSRATSGTVSAPNPGAIASDGTGFFALGTAGQDVWGTSIDASLAASPPHVVSNVLAGRTPSAAASNGSSFLAVWSDARGVVGGYHVFASLIGLDGTVGKRGIAIGPDVSSVVSRSRWPGVASSGSSYLVAWSRGDGIEGALVSDAGVPSAPFAVGPATNYAYAPSAASNGAEYLVAWEDDGHLVSDVVAARVDGTGKVLDATPIHVAQGSPVPNDLVSPVVAHTTGAYVVAWRHGDGAANGAYAAYAAWVGDDGAIRVPPFEVSSGQTDAGLVSVACSPAECVMAWVNGPGVWIRRYDASGVPLDVPVVVPGAEIIPSVLWDGKAFVIVSVDSGSARARWMGTDGSWLPTAPATLAPVNSGAGPSAASNGNGVNLMTLFTTGVRFVDDDPEPTDAGLGGHDANVPDAPDGASPDAGGDAAPTSDAATADAGDATTADAATADAATAAPDAASTDAGPATDASARDAAATLPADGGSDAATTAPDVGGGDEGGCGCTTAGASTRAPVGAIAGAAMLLLGLVRRRRG